MPDILIRELDAQTVKQLKARAKRHGRSLQGEAKLLLEQAAGIGGQEVAAMLDGWKRRFTGRKFSDSADMIAEDRQR